MECILCASLVLTRPRQKKKKYAGSSSDVDWLENLSGKLVSCLSLQCRRKGLKLYDTLYQYNLHHRNQGVCVSYLWFGEELFWLLGDQTASGNYLFQRQSHISLVLGLLLISPCPVCHKSQANWKQWQQKSSLVSIVPKMSKTESSPS